MIKIQPVTRGEYLKGFRQAQRSAFGRGGQKIFTGVCPLCSRPTGGSAIYVVVSADQTELLAGEEQKARDPKTMRGTFVGGACFRRIGGEYRGVVEVEAAHGLH